MRCLYCGNELALLRKLTGYGEFCSEAHRQKYQEQYNRLALTRLLQAQDTEAERRPLTTPLRASRPSGAIGPGKTRREIEAPASNQANWEAPSWAAEVPGTERAPVSPLDLRGFLPHQFEPAVSQVELCATDPVLMGSSHPLLPGSSEGRPDPPAYGILAGGDVVPDPIPDVPVLNGSGVGWVKIGESRPIDLTIARTAGLPIRGESVVGFAFPAEYVRTLREALELVEDAKSGNAVPPPPPGTQVRRNGSAPQPNTRSGSVERREADADPFEPAPAPPRTPANNRSRDRVEVVINWAALGMLDPDAIPPAEAPTSEVPAVSGEGGRPAPLQEGPAVQEPSPIPPFSTATPLVDEGPAAVAPVPEPGAVVPAEPLAAAPAMDTQGPAFNSGAPALEPIDTPARAEAPTLSEFVGVEGPEPVSSAPAAPPGPEPVAATLSPVEPAAASEIPASAPAEVVPALCARLATIDLELAQAAFTPTDESAVSEATFEIQTPVLAASPLRPKLVFGPSPAVAVRSAEDTGIVEAAPQCTGSAPAAADESVHDSGQISEPDAASAGMKAPPTPAAVPGVESTSGGATPRLDKGRRKMTETADLEALRAEMERQVQPRLAASRTRRIAVLVALVLAVLLVMYLIHEALVPKAAATASSGNVEAYGPSLISGEGGWSVDWAGQTPGSVLGRQVYIFRPSLTMTDYRFEFQGQIESRGMGWVFRAANPRNYYAMKLEMVKAGPDPKVALIRAAVINGEETQKSQIDLPMPVHLDTVYKVREDVLGSTFRTYIQDKLVDTWSDDRLASGGIGLWKDKDEAAQVRLIQLHGLRRVN